MAREVSVLFVCTGNIFRSMTAEYALRQALGEQPVRVGSAGLIDAPHEIVDFVRDYLSARDLDISQHVPTRLQPAMLDDADLVVAMDFAHRDAIETRFGRRMPLFSEVAFGNEAPLLDVYEVVPDWRDNEAAATQYGRSVMDTIFDGMPGFVRRMHDFIDR